MLKTGVRADGPKCDITGGTMCDITVPAMQLVWGFRNTCDYMEIALAASDSSYLDIPGGTAGKWRWAWDGSR